jgi:2-hydroxychromene-2-carboxylate isomerase
LRDRSRPIRGARPAFFFDLSCPFSYLAAERVERVMGEVEWVPTPGIALHGAGPSSRPAAPCDDVERRAAALRLPLVWPDGFPGAVPGAMRAAVRAADIGAGARFALAASRLAFCGGFDLEDPEILAEAAAAADVPLEACLEAAGDPAIDAQLHATASGLLARGLRRLPAIRVDRLWFDGEHRLVEAGAMARARAALAPAG